MPYKNSRVNRVLERLSVGHYPMGFIGKKILTPLNVPQWTGIIPSYGNAHLQLKTSRVYDRGEYKVVNSVNRNVSETYSLSNHGLQDIVTERDREEVETPFEAEADVSMGLRQLLMSECEFAVATLLRNTQSYASGNSITLSGNSQFSDFANSDPTAVVSTAKNKIFEASGVMGNWAVIPYDVMEKLRSHPKLTGIYGLSGVFNQISVDQLKSALGLENILIPTSNYVASESATTPTFFWGKDIIIYNRAPSTMRRQRTFGYTLTKSGHEGRVFRREHEAIPNAIRIMQDTAYNFIVQNSGAGYIIKNAIA